ncbi:MAG: anthranilate phosphoribosyltransferase [Salinivirgaceae bacterium]|jgi:anthranilate phosphoribosyltransferase|nr:anthranilate phosphoribosyltransferase [Salinivirgaceae bacterium]
MSTLNIREFAKIITKLINKENLSREDAYNAFSVVLKNETTEMQQGAFLAALTSKGETKEEIAGCWQAIYEFDTIKVQPNVKGPIVENSGTGMDSFKTFNISTCASLVAAADGVYMARHGARALTSMCGTVDMAEALGVNVECETEKVKESIEKAGIGLFNGMSPKVHPMALGRILSQISFGSTLNIAASLASPVKADIGVRGVYSRQMIRPVIEVMKEIGYKKAIVYNGSINNSDLSMDEASVSGITHCAELKEGGEIIEFSFSPEESGIITSSPNLLSPEKSINNEKENILKLLSGKSGGAREDAVALNAGLIFYLLNKSSDIKTGTMQAKDIIKSGKSIDTLEKWVQAQ